MHDEDDQKSISGQISTLGRMIVGWESKKQHMVSLSSCKSEYIAYGEVCQEPVFMCQLMEEIFGENISRVVYNERGIVPS